MTMLRTVDVSALDGLVSSLETPVFLAGMDESSRPCLTLHTAVRGTRRKLRNEARRALAGAGIEARCKVREHVAKRLAKDTSLEQLIGRFRHDAIVFDPTGGIGRAEAVTRCAANIRGALGAGVAGIYIEPWRRALYVVLHRDFVVRDGKAAPDRLHEIETSVATAVSDGLDGIAGSMALAVRVGFALPNTPVVPVDAASARAGRTHPQLLAKLRAGSIAATVAAFFGVGIAGSAMAEGPAVAYPNARVSIGGGATDGDGTGLISGAGTMPLGQSYGVQIDGALGTIAGDLRYGLAGHLFWRDPDTGLLGAVASFGGRGSDDWARLGAEGELYKGQFTGIGYAGYQFDDNSGPFGRIDLRWYGTDDFMLGAGGELRPGTDVARFKVEYQPGIEAIPGLSLFADGDVGTGGYSRIFVGMKIYFGGEVKSLIRRHREDDPTTRYADGVDSSSRRRDNGEEYET